jgi:hypothetical protein
MPGFVRIGLGGVIAAVVIAVTLGPLAAYAGDKDKDRDKDKDDQHGARAADGGAAAQTPTTAHGANFLVKSQLDATFCIQVGAGTNEGRTITLVACGTADTQRWAFTWNADDTNSIVESQGMCLDGRARKGGDGLALPVQKCRFNDAWRFTFTASGLIKDVKNNKCLSIPGAAANVAVSLADCDETKKTQLWKLAH